MFGATLWTLTLFLLIAELSLGLPSQFRFNRLRRYRDQKREQISDFSVSDNVKEKYFTQKLCHFCKMKDRWRQRYWQNDQYYKKGGPQFLNIGGEGEESGSIISNPAYPLVQWAKKLGARLWNLEHRFYGKSRPTKDQSVKSLKFLNSRQALEDLADFIKSKNQELKLKNPKWVVFGGSYPGALTLWFRQKHPDLTVGGVGSSAPVEVVTDFFDYLRVCEDSFRSFSSKCADNIALGFETLREHLDSTDGRDQLDEAFNFDPPLSQQNLTFKNMQNLYMTIVGNFQTSVQYSRVNAGVFKTGASIPDVCKIMEQPAFNPVSRLVNVNSYMEKEFDLDPGTTYDSYEEIVKVMQDTSFDNPDASSRSWVWQTCNEFGYFQSTDLNGVFGTTAPVDFDIDFCIDIFGSKFTVDYIRSRVQTTIDNYGRAGDYNGTNVVIPNGSLDPWHALGAYTPQYKSATSILINGTAHCADMEPADDQNDPQSLKDARALIFQKLQEWTGVKSSEVEHSVVESKPEDDDTKLTVRRAPDFDSKICWNCKIEPKAGKMRNPMPVEMVKRVENKFIGGRHTSGGFRRRDLLEKKYANRTRHHNSVQYGTIVQPVDHFDTSDTRTFKQLIYWNDEYFDKSAAEPLVFVYNPGEGAANDYVIDYPEIPMVGWAKKFGAMLYILEHRFYGQSWPFDSMSVDNLKYLTSEQALADIANFIKNTNKDKGWKNARWIPFGGSYAGAMTAWMRSTYPDLTFAAVGSSGPVEAIVDFYGYFQTVENSVRAYDPKCGDSLASALDYVHQLMTTVEGRKKLDANLDVTPPFGDAEFVDQFDVMDFYDSITMKLCVAVQYTNHFESIQPVCDVLTSSEPNELKKLALGLGLGYVTHDMKDTIESFKYDSDIRAWFWQTCNEFGFYQSTDIGFQSAFGSEIPINYYLRWCSDAYDSTLKRDELERRIEATNKRYGGARGYRATRSIQVYGTLDPWHTLGFYGADGSRGEDVVTILMNGTSHCADMDEPSDSDVPDLVEARKTIEKYLTKWITKS